MRHLTRTAPVPWVLVLMLAVPSPAREPEHPQRGERDPGGSVAGVNSAIHGDHGSDSSEQSVCTDWGPWERPRNALVYHGRVVLADRGAAYEPIMIERVCGGDEPVPEAYTDLRGRFAIELGWYVHGTVDASRAFPSGQTRVGRPPNGLSGCELRASLPGYRSESIYLGDPGLRAHGRLGTIRLHRLGGSRGETISETSAEAPRRARRHYVNARLLADRGEFYQAALEYEKAVERFPRYAAAWTRLGDLLRVHGDYDRAHSAYGQALAADPALTQPYEGLYAMAVQQRRWARVAELARHLSTLRPVEPEPVVARSFR